MKTIDTIARETCKKAIRNRCCAVLDWFDGIFNPPAPDEKPWREIHPLVPLKAGEAEQIRLDILYHSEVIARDGHGMLFDAIDCSGACFNCFSSTGHSSDCPRYKVVSAALHEFWTKRKFHSDVIAVAFYEPDWIIA